MGWPFLRGPWCNSDLKRAALQRMAYAKGAVVQQTEGAICKKNGSPDGGAVKNAVVDYIGIAADEPIRIERHQGKPGKEMPLVEAGWTEQMCWKWCKENGLLSPLYATANRGGCWFCHNQPVDQLRQLRRDYPELWALMLKWDSDSPVFFHSDGQTVHDFDQRFDMEDKGFFKNEKFRWESLKAAQMNIDQFL